MVEVKLLIKQAKKGDKEAIRHTRSIEFKGIGEKLELDIQRIRYKRLYDDTIYKYSIK